MAGKKTTKKAATPAKAKPVEEPVEEEVVEEVEEEEVEENGAEDSEVIEDGEEESEESEAEQDGSIDVDAILQNKFKPSSVDKDDDLVYDLLNMTAIDIHPINTTDLRANQEEYLANLSRDNTQLLFTHMFQLPTRMDVTGVMAQLPAKATSKLPRSKPFPKLKTETKWEKYAKLKGIQKKKKERMVWDEETKTYRPRWGAQRANDKEKQWVIEHNDHDTSGVEDPFLKLKMDKKKRVDKNERQRAGNLKKSNEAALPGGVAAPSLSASKKKSLVGNTLDLASFSTASVGRFDKRLPGEKSAPERKGKSKLSGITEKHSEPGSEKANMMKVAEKMLNKQSTLDMDKAAGKIQQQTQRKRNAENRQKILSKTNKKQRK